MNDATHYSVDREKIEKTKRLKPSDILAILEDFRKLSKTRGQKLIQDKTILISLKVSESLLKEFKETCTKQGLKYQTHIKELMRAWLREK